MIGFSNGAFVKIWNVKNEGKYSTARVTSSVKHKDGEYVVGTLVKGYDVRFQDSYVRLVGTAHEKIQSLSVPEKGGLSIKILQCNTTNKLKTENEKTTAIYTNSIHDFIVPDSETVTPQTTANTTAADDDDDLPF